MSIDTLTAYRNKRNFKKTPEPSGKAAPQKKTPHAYVIQKHAASHLHYDFRLEMDGTLKSWAIPKGPSLDPSDKRLAVQVEDHPIEYGSFEGTIPEGEYGGGTVMLWDQGTWSPLGDENAAYKKGDLAFELHGARLKGKWHLVRMRRKSGKPNWLLIKSEDRFANDGSGDYAIEKYQKSVASKRSMEQIAKGNKSWSTKEARIDDPKPKKRVSTNLKSPPNFIEPQLATMVHALPASSGWLHEVKFDGYRILARIENGKTHMLTRAGNDWTDKFSMLAEDLGKLDVTNAILDGEVAATQKDGKLSFHALQEALSENKQEAFHYYIFDLLFLNGEDLRRKPLVERKKELRAILPENHEHLHYSEEFTEPGPEVLKHACNIGLEGIVSKLEDAPYVSGRTKSWLKAKCRNEQEMVIGGFSYQPKHKSTLAALLMGYYRGNDLIYAGKVGTGFSSEEADELVKKLLRLRIDKPVFASVPKDAKRNAVWVKPKLVAQISFAEWTTAGVLRQPSFHGLREDKPPRQVARETESDDPHPDPLPYAPIPGKAKAIIAGIPITHADKIFYPEAGITKRDIAEYFEAISPYMLPHVSGRPISLVRCPDGREKSCIFQRHPSLGLSPEIKPVTIAIHETRDFLTVDTVQGLVALAQMGVIEIHTWGAKAEAIETPDRIVFDLDPAPDMAWKNVKDAAKELRERMKDSGLQSFPLVTGGKGIHVVSPIDPGPAWADVKLFAYNIAKQMAVESPSLYTVSMRKDERPGRIYIDYLRNQKGASFIAPYSPRVREGAPVATPLEWRELNRTQSARPYTIKNIMRHVRKNKKVWSELAGIGQKMPVR